VVYLGEEWNPTTPYYADRPGFMLTSQIADRATVERLAGDDDYRYVFSFNPYADPIHFLDAWPWVGVIGPRTYVVGQQREDVDDAPVFASTRTSDARGETSALQCDGRRVAIAGGDLPTVISTPDAEDVRIIVGHELAPLPRVGTIYSRDDSTLECSGVRAVEVVTAPTG
jgi:hypothetical protein